MDFETFCDPKVGVPLMLKAINDAVMRRRYDTLRELMEIVPPLVRHSHYLALYRQDMRYFDNLYRFDRQGDFFDDLLDDFFVHYQGTPEDNEALHFLMDEDGLRMYPYFMFCRAIYDKNYDVATYILQNFSIEDEEKEDEEKDESSLENRYDKPTWALLFNNISPERREEFLMPYAYLDLEHYNTRFPLDDIIEKYQMVIQDLLYDRLPKEMIFEILAAEGFSRKSIEYLWSIGGKPRRDEASSKFFIDF